jgi:hypothetical protein
MKKLLSILLASLTLISCSKDDIIFKEEVLITDGIDEVAVLNFINGIRTHEYKIGDVSYVYADELMWDSKLKKISQLQTIYMFENNDFYSVWLDGTDLDRRFEMANCDYIPRYECYTKHALDCAQNDAIKFLADENFQQIMDKNYNIVAVTKKGEYWSMVLAFKPAK